LIGGEVFQKLETHMLKHSAWSESVDTPPHSSTDRHGFRAERSTMESVDTEASWDGAGKSLERIWSVATIQAIT